MITVVARPRVPGGNTVELTLERDSRGYLSRSRPITYSTDP